MKLNMWYNKQELISQHTDLNNKSVLKACADVKKAW